MTHSARIIPGKLTLAVILFALCCVFTVRADDAQTASKVAASVELLGDERSKVRNEAYAALERMLEHDEKITGYLQKFKSHEDPEIATRIKGLLQQQNDKILEQEKQKAQALEFKKLIAKLRVLEKQADGLLRLNPADENKARSLLKTKSLHKIKLSITNQSKDPIKVYYMCACKHKKEGGGNRKVHLKKLEPGKTHNCKETWEQRVYVLTDMNDKSLGLYLTGEKDASIVLK